MTRTIFAHESGDTLEMQHTLVCTGRDRFSHAHKPVALVSKATRSHERAYHELWAFKGEFKTARQVVRALVMTQDLSSPSAVY
jgi:hypothetical protein